MTFASRCQWYGAHMAIFLNSALLVRIGTAIKRGVPARVAAGAHGVPPRTLQKWLALGAAMEKPKPPPAPDAGAKLLEVEGSGPITEAEWWAHEFACWSLAGIVLKWECNRVGTMMASMWDAAAPRKVRGLDGGMVEVPADAEMQRFLFKHYGHVHGLIEKPGAARASDKGANPSDPTAEDAEAAAVVICVPDNGRGPKQ